MSNSVFIQRTCIKSIVPAIYTLQWYAPNYALHRQLALQMVCMGCVCSAISDGNTEDKCSRQGLA